MASFSLEWLCCSWILVLSTRKTRIGFPLDHGCLFGSMFFFCLKQPFASHFRILFCSNLVFWALTNWSLETLAFWLLWNLCIFFALGRTFNFFVTWQPLTFENTSSIGHVSRLLAWIPLLANPLGISLAWREFWKVLRKWATSRRGKNQFLIYGSATGMDEMILYISLLFFKLRCIKFFFIILPINNNCAKLPSWSE